MAATGDAAGAGTFGPLAAMRQQYPGWKLWRSDARRFWATRTGRLPVHPPGGFAMTVSGDTARELAEALADQEAKTSPD